MKNSALPFPLGVKLQVYRDDGQWDNYRAWFLRPVAVLHSLLVTRITLGHYVTESGPEPAYSPDEWHRKAEQLVADYPDCVFVYGSNS